MSLEVRFTWIGTVTLVLTICSIVLLFVRRYSIEVHRYNRFFLNTIGIELKEGQWSYWIVSWIMGTGVATLFLTLLVNLADFVLFLTGQSGIGFDPAIIPILILFLIISLLLLIAIVLPILASPPACPTAFVIFVILHTYGFHGSIIMLNASMALYFIAIAIGLLGSILSVYIFIVIVIRLLRGTEIIQNETKDKTIREGSET